MNLLELLHIPGLSNETKLEELRLESQKRLDKAYKNFTYPIKKVNNDKNLR